VPHLEIGGVARKLPPHPVAATLCFFHFVFNFFFVKFFFKVFNF